MNPERMIEDQDQVNALLFALRRFANKIITPAGRHNVLTNAGVSNIDPNGDPAIFANALVSAIKTPCISGQGAESHPMIKFLKYLREDPDPPGTYGINDNDLELFDLLIRQGSDRFMAMQARRAVGKIENELGVGIGTGVLVGANLLLTCWHVFERNTVHHAGVRFGNKVNCDGSTAKGTRFDLSIQDADIVSRGGGTRPDYALLRIKGSVVEPPQVPRNTQLSSGQQIRIIHHPKGAAAVVSDWGEISQVGPDYIDHNLITAPGSSGAPIFDASWNMVALHRGDPTVARQVPAGTSSGVPIRAIWGEIQSHLN